MLALINANAVLSDKILPSATILIDGDAIAAVGQNVEIPKETLIYDCAGMTVGPGFVDIHVHGGGDSFFFENPEKTAKHFLNHGETTVLPTLYYDLDKERFLEAIKTIKRAVREGKAPTVAGIYMEGPYMNPKYGASPEKNKWVGEIRPEDYAPLLKEAGELARVWVVAPEREGIEDFVKDAKTHNPNAVISVGHSEASPDEVFALKKYGLSLMTHCMNATGRKNAEPGTRSCGPDEACLLDDDIYAEMICDSGAIHVHPDMQKLLLKVKGEDKVVLISDSFVSYEKSPENLSHLSDLSFDKNGGLSGSRLTLDVALKNVMRHTGCSLVTAFKLASLNPAKAVGLDDVGKIALGKKANFVLLDENFNLKKVILNGNFVN